MGEIIWFICAVMIMASVCYFMFDGHPIESLVKYFLKKRKAPSVPIPPPSHKHDWGLWERRTSKMHYTNEGVKVPGSDFMQAYQERRCRTCGSIEHADLNY